MIKFILIFLMILTVVTCADKAVKISVPPKKSVGKIEKIILSEMEIEKYSTGLDFYCFRPTTLMYKKELWLNIFDRKNLFFRLFSFKNPNKIDSIIVPWSSKDFFLVDNVENTFYVYFPQKSIIEVYNLNDSGLRMNKRILISEYDTKYVFLRRKFFEPLIDTNGLSVIISYAIHDSPKTSYKDIEGNFLQLKQGGQIFSKIGHYPNDFFRTVKYYYSPLFTSDKKGKLYYTFELHDSVYQIDLAGNKIKAASIGGNSFLKFDSKKEMDLAYVRKYTEETERNERILFLKNNFIVVLKKLPKKGVLSNNNYKYFVLDSNLNLKNTDTIRHYCYPWFISEYKNGFLLLGDSLKSAYYYEINAR